jgi:hypothetical protein
MKIRKLYKYIGRNGSITSPVLLEDIKHIALVELKAEAGYILRNDDMFKPSVIVHVDDMASWEEVPADISE